MAGADPMTVGVLGGMSSASTVEYYRGIDRGVDEALDGHHDGDLLIRSVNFGRVEQYIDEDRWDEAGEYLAGAAERLEAGGADFVVLATNTMHRVADSIEAALSVPFLHIVDVTATAIAAADVDRVGLLGTEAVMTGDFYADRLRSHGVEVVVPDAAARAEVDRIIFEELTDGVVRDDSRDRYLGVVDDLVGAGAGGVVLGCTEIGLLVDQSDRPGVPLFDTTELHVERAVERSLEPVSQV